LSSTSLLAKMQQNGNDSQPSSASATAPAKMSFSITKQTKKSVVKSTFLSNSGIIEIDDEESHSQKRSVAYLEDGVVKDDDNFPMRKKEKKEYLIPMKRTGNDWRIERLKKIIEEGTGTEEDKARLALMLDAIGGNVQEEGMTTSNNGVISHDTSDKKEEVLDADYEKIPIGEFGLAFLRGCGWKETDGIGKTNRKTVPLKISEPRPKGLGLGADVSQSGKQKDPKDKNKKGLEKNARVKILSGTDRGLSGQIKSMDEDNSSCFVELDGGSRRIVRVSQFALEVIDKKV